MPQFKYEGFDESGGRLDSVVQADSEAAALDDLRRRGILVSRLQPVGSERDWRSVIGLGDAEVGLAELEFLTAELSLLLESGVRIDRAVGILQRAGKGGAMSRLLDSLSGELKQGRQLSEALAKHPEVFNSLYINLVALGEAGGRLPEVFRGLADELRFQRDLRQKVLSASTYPLVVAGVCVAAVVFIFNFVVPNLRTLFADAAELPWYTTVLLESSAFLRQWQWLILGVVVISAVTLWRARRSPFVVELQDRLLLDVP
ncbi:MAG: type II secretion system F family protein, partial [Gammaproteobacteria bacterium]|nr:type II secretion system F family protein [Gammaproteobacteria bacterium]